MTATVAIGRLVDAVEKVDPVRVWPGGTFSYVDIAAVDQASKAIVQPQQVDSSDAPSRARQLICAGDILVSTVRPNLNAVALVPAQLDGAVASTGLSVLRPRAEVLDYRYLFHWVRSPPFVSEMTRRATGASYPAVSDAIVKASEVPLPPIEEQRRIAAVLDEADELRAKRQSSAVLLGVLVRSIFLEMFGHPAENPRKLPTTTLGELAEWRSGGTPPRSEARFFLGSVPWFSSGELGPVFIESSTECVSEEAIRQTSAKEVPAGSLMLGMYDTAALKSSIAVQRCSCNQAVAFASIPTDVASTRFVHAAIQVGREFYRSKQRGVRQKNLNLSMVRSLEIPLPSIEDQARFESLARAVDSQCRRALEHAATISDLRSSLQHRAFAGQL